MINKKLPNVVPESTPHPNFLKRSILRIVNTKGGKSITRIFGKRETIRGWSPTVIGQEYLVREKKKMLYRSKVMVKLGINGKKASEAKQLFRIFDATASLAQDTHNGACSVEVAKKLSAFVKSEFQKYPDLTHPYFKRIGANAEITKKVISENVASLEGSYANPSAWKVAEKRIRSDMYVEGIVARADLALFGKAAKTGHLVDSNLLFFSCCAEMARARIMEMFPVEQHYAIEAWEKEGLM